MADIPIELLYTLTPDKAPDPGTLDPGVVAVELASNPVKAWIGVPSSVDADEQRLLINGTASLSLPDADGIYLLQKDGNKSAWENHIVLPDIPQPGLLFINESSYPTISAYSGSRSGSIFASSTGWLDPNAAFAWARWDAERLAGHGLLVFAQGSNTGIYVDYAGDRSGVIIETTRAGGRGLEILRSDDSDASIRLGHGPAFDEPRTPTGHLLGNIAFAGITERFFPDQTGIFWPVPEIGGYTVVKNGAEIRGVSTEPWSPTVRGTRLEFWTTPNGTAAPQRAVTIDHNGVLNLTGTGAAYHVNGVPLAPGGDGATQPGGTNLQVQYNNNGTAFAGASGVTIAPNTNSLTVSGTLTADTIAASGNITNFLTADTKRMTLRRGLMVGSAAFCDDWSENDEGVGSIHAEGLVQISEYFVNPISRAGIALKSWNNSSEISAQRFVGTPDTMWDLEVPVNTEIFRITGYGYAPYSQYMAATIGLGVSDVAGEGILAFYTSEGQVSYRRVTIEKGLVISDHTSTTLADMGAGTVNVSHGFYIEGQDLIDVLTAIFDARYAPI